MIILSSEAEAYDCCMQDKRCTGENCMAWKWYFKDHRESVKNGGHGYCGMVPCNIKASRKKSAYGMGV